MGGRAKGTPNKITATVREAFELGRRWRSLTGAVIVANPTARAALTYEFRGRLPSRWNDGLGCTILNAATIGENHADLRTIERNY